MTFNDAHSKLLTLAGLRECEAILSRDRRGNDCCRLVIMDEDSDFGQETGFGESWDVAFAMLAGRLAGGPGKGSA